MANPVNKKSVTGATGTTAGESTRSRAHYHLTLHANAANIDTTNDTLTVELQGSPDRATWDTVATLTQSDFDSDLLGTTDPTGSATVTGAYYEHLRVAITEFTDAAGADLSVDAWIMAAGNAGQGVKGNPDG